MRQDSFWDKMGTLGRKKKAAEVQQVEVEGKHAIDSPGMPKLAEVPPEEYLLEENEERSMIEPRSYDNPRLKDLIAILIEWVNDELHSERIIVQVRLSFFCIWFQPSIEPSCRTSRKTSTTGRSCRSCWRS